MATTTSTRRKARPATVDQPADSPLAAAPAQNALAAAAATADAAPVDAGSTPTPAPRARRPARRPAAAAPQAAPAADTAAADMAADAPDAPSAADPGQSLAAQALATTPPAPEGGRAVRPAGRGRRRAPSAAAPEQAEHAGQAVEAVEATDAPALEPAAAAADAPALRRPRPARPAPRMAEADAAASADLAREVLALLLDAGAAPEPATLPAATVEVPTPAPAPDAMPADTVAAEPSPRPPRGSRRDRPERPERQARGERAARPQRPEQPERAERPERPERQPAQAGAHPLPTPAEAAASGPAHSAVRLLPGSAHRIVWQPGQACPAELRAAAAAQVDAQQQIAPENDEALPLLLRLAQAAGHALAVDAAVWPHLAAHRDARTRLALLEAAYPAGPASPGLARLLRAPLAPFQAEGALFAAVAGRALLADERGLGKGVTALAAATLMQRHFGVQRVLLVCAAGAVAAWQRAWQRFAPPAAGQAPVLHVEGGLHQRQAGWSRPASVRLISPEALASDAAHLAHWAPGLVIVDEPQALGLRPADWALLDAPHALVLCGAALAEQPALMHQLVDWLDTQRLGPLAALEELQAAADEGRPLDEQAVERLSASLSRLMLQRSRADVADQLPAVVHSERLLPLAPAQREAHDAALGQARQLLAGWQASAYLSDADQWQLLQALQTMRRAALRVQPGLADSALADAVVQAVAAQWDDWRGTAAAADEGAAPFQALLLCDTEADRAQLAARLPELDADPATPGAPRLLLAGPGTAWPDGVDAVLQLGVPWRTRRAPLGGRAPAGQQWVCLVGQGSLDAGLFDTLAQRGDLPRSLLDGGRGFLQGERLQQWLGAVQAALAALPAMNAAA